ncbi:MAG: cation diffusion facilitator family transporter [Ignavibacteria bacterium]|nr:cation diffusion facilitator family transporter [Ignavibacteria bacterium]
MNDKIADINKKKMKVAKVSLFVAIFIVLLKTSASIWSGSLAVLSELFHSSTDLIASLVTIISLKYSARPPDEDHHYGHDKIESFSALIQVLVLVFMCVYILYEAVSRIINPPSNVNIDYYSFLVISVCIVLDFTRSRALKKTARETNSQALEADALHFSSDILSSGVVLIGIALYYIEPVFDPIAAIIVSVIIIMITSKLTKKAYDSLMDKVPKGMYEKIKNVITSTEGIEGLKNLRVRSTSSKIFIDATVNVGRTKLFYETHEITEKIEDKIKKIAENADIILHTEPVESKDETINDKIRIIVNNSGYRCHDIFTYKYKNRITAELHIEIPNTKALTEAHDTVTRLEEKIKNGIKVIDDVKVHIDKPGLIADEAEDITNKSNEIVRITENIIKENRNVLNFHHIKVFRLRSGLRLSCDCEFEHSIPFDRVHNFVTELESKIYIKLKELYPELINIIIHAEPKGQ